MRKAKAQAAEAQHVSTHRKAVAQLARTRDELATHKAMTGSQLRMVLAARVAKRNK